MVFTVKSVATKLQVQDVTAYGLLKAFQTAGVIAPKGVQANSSGKGRGAAQFEFTADSETKLREMLTKMCI